ncbi:hypothetical protein AtubIFM57143_008732 [Aspergillus tubingensis]|nr:hypothetical protein AtubIFM57143_008732 [Aspergillus tubingensis]
MERIKGNYIGAGWVYRSEESKAKILTQLKNIVEEMRRLPPPAGMGAGSVVDGSLYDCRVPGTSLRFGPFSQCPGIPSTFARWDGFRSKA